MMDAPLCPSCGKPLETLTSMTTDALYWEESEGEYQQSGHSSGTYTCPECGKVVGTWREGGYREGFTPQIAS